MPERERAIWAVDQVQVYDAGTDGVVGTPAGERVYMREGIFIP